MIGESGKAGASVEMELDVVLKISAEGSEVAGRDDASRKQGTDAEDESLRGICCDAEVDTDRDTEAVVVGFGRTNGSKSH